MFPGLMVPLQKRGTGFSPTILLPVSLFLRKSSVTPVQFPVKLQPQGENMLAEEEVAGPMIRAGLYRVSTPEGCNSSRLCRRCLVMLYPGYS